MQPPRENEETKCAGEASLWPPLTVIALLALMALGGYLRLSYARFTNPYIDEYTTFWMAQRTIELGLPLFPTGVLYNHGLLFTYLDALFIYLFGFSELVARLPSVIIGVGAIPLLYGVGRRLLSPREGLLAATLLAVDPQAIIWGGRARNYTLVLFLLLVATLLAYEGIIKRDRALYRRLYLLTLVLAFLAHSETLLLLPPFLLCALLWRGWRWFTKPDVFLEHLLCLAGAVLTLLLWRLAKPSGWQAMGESYSNLAPSLEFWRALGRYKPFFLGPDHLPFVGFLTAFALLGLAYLLWSAWRKGKPQALLQDEGGAVFLYLLFGLFTLEMIFLVGKERWSPRYFFILAPHFFLLATFGVMRGFEGLMACGERLKVRLPRATALFFTLGAMIIATLLALPAARAAASQKEWGYNLAFRYVKENFRQGDAVMTFWVTPCPLYLGRCDYVAVEKYFSSYVKREGKYWMEYWGGLPLLSTDQELKEAIGGHDRVWFIIDEERFRTRYTPTFIQYVWDRMELVAQEDGVFIFRADNPPPPPLPIRRPLALRLGEEIALLGYGLSGDALHPGQEMVVSLRWQGLVPIQRDLSVFVKLFDAQGRLWAQEDSAPLGGLHPTSHWVAGEIINDRHVLTLPSDIPPGRYRLEAGIYSPQTLKNLSVSNLDGQVLGEQITLDYVKITGGEELSPSHRLQANYSHQVDLWGYDLAEREIEPGGNISLSLYWRARRAMEKNYTVFVHLVDEGGTIWGQKDNWPEEGFYPTSFWEPGEVVKDDYVFLIDPATPPGRYGLEVGLYLLDTGERLPIIEMGKDMILLAEVEVR